MSGSTPTTSTISTAASSTSPPFSLTWPTGTLPIVRWRRKNRDHTARWSAINSRLAVTVSNPVRNVSVLHSIKRLDRCRILATDAEVGSVSDTCFDDARWVVRYLIVETRNGLHEHSVPISLSRRQIEGSPGIDTDRPVSRQHESEYHRYYGYPEYWPYTTNWAWGAMPVVRPTDESQAWAARQRSAAEVHEEQAADAHL